jgi:hypothetical protein
MDNKKAAPFFGRLHLFSWFLLGVRNFGEPPMSECVHGNKSQDDGDKGNGDYVKHGGDERGQAAYRHKRCQLSV